MFRSCPTCVWVSSRIGFICVFPGALKAEPRTFSMTFSPLPIRSVAMVDCTIVGLGWGLGGTRSR